MMRSWCGILVVCFTLQLQQITVSGLPLQCEQLCKGLGVENGCKYAEMATPREEVIVVTNGTSDIKSWLWDTITMVVSSHFSSTKRNGLTACYAHSVGRRYGLRETVPTDLEKIINETEKVKKDFTEMITKYQRLLMADHIVYDFLDFFSKTFPVAQNQTEAVLKMIEILSYATTEIQKLHHREVYCIMPWEPPCDLNCHNVQTLLGKCDVIMMSPDSYMPKASSDGSCIAQATVPISKFLYGVDRYISLRTGPNAQMTIVAGIPWHGFSYKCDNPITVDNRCIIKREKGDLCFNATNREKRTLSNIHGHSYPDVQMDELSKGVFKNIDSTTQVWFENFTTLLIKYQLVQDLQLKGLSIWSGEDIVSGVSIDTAKFSAHSWDFLTHHVLHKAVYTPTTHSHYYADTVAGVAVGCLLLGTALGVTFTCIAFRRSDFRKRNRPFKVDEDEDGFRDDEGL